MTMYIRQYVEVKGFNVKKMLFLISCVIVMFGVVENSIVNPRSEAVSFKQCLISSPTSFGYCVGMEALSKLQTIDNESEFDIVDGVTFSRDDQQVRESYNFIDRNPGDFRTIVDSVGDVFSRKNLKWDMGFIYPGLTMRVAPSVSPAGVLEFVMDPLREAHSKHTLKEASTGQLLARQFLLPFLAGFKFNVAALIPIIFGLIALVIKKALFLSKLGLVISTAIGLGTLLFGNKHQPVPAHGGYGGGPYGTGAYGGGNYGYAQHNRYPEEEYYKDSLFRAGDSNNVENQVRFINTDEVTYSRSDKTSGRNFAWNDDEMKKKTKVTKN